ncbi:tetratricopeptide repeat protein [Dongia sedimenti]|uniref:Tetratricopeptide repeat protein n=1 Tax=Dongia sedimenti TaxID=3064282 RepID=A0ABU0YG75_9PROT|nr:tetratricopeptide repeat protein [Rhodospirillaceae bacterium R-7]
MRRFLCAVSAAVCTALLVQACATTGAKTTDATASVEACFAATERREGDKAIALCDSALATPGLSADLQAKALAARGASYNDKKAYARGVADFNQALVLKPDDLFALSNRGWAYNQMADFDRAVADFDRVISLRPSEIAYANRSYAYALKGDFTASIRDLDRAIQLKPDGAELYSNRGWAHMMLGEMVPALTDLSRAVELNPKLARTYENRSTLYFIQGDYGLAAADIERAIEISPDNPFGYIWLYIATRRDHRDASAVLQKAAKANADWPAVILRFIQGKATELNVHEEVRSEPYGAISKVRDCHTQLILGELALLDQWTETAASHFRYASSACPLAQTERVVAEAELKRL